MAERAEITRLIEQIVGCADVADGGRSDARAYAKKLVQAARSTRGSCVWNEDDDGTWESTCGEHWQFIEGGPTQNGVRYCHGCGRAVKANPYSE